MGAALPAASAASGSRAGQPLQPGILAAKFGDRLIAAQDCRKAGRRAGCEAPAELGLACFKYSLALCAARCRLSASERRKDGKKDSGKPAGFQNQDPQSLRLGQS